MVERAPSIVVRDGISAFQLVSISALVLAEVLTS
jgi:hypothetical protein